MGGFSVGGNLTLLDRFLNDYSDLCGVRFELFSYS